MVRVIATVCLLCAASVSHAVHIHSSANGTDEQIADLSNRNLYYVRKIFAEFGDGESISIEGFLRMMDVGKLQQLSNGTETDARTKIKNGTVSFRDNVTRVQNEDVNLKCVRDAELISSNNSSNSSITVDTFYEFCPMLLYNFVAKSEYENQHGCIYVPSLSEQSPISDGREITFEVWLCAVASVIVVSLCGLFGVAVIPFMEYAFYQQMLQFLVALAIGTLCGDALLHLLPHAIAGEHDETDSDHSEHSHHSEDMVLKGLVAVLGIILFFFTEKFLTVVAEYRKRRQKKREVPPTVRVVHDSDGARAPSAGDKLCKHKYSSSPYCYDEITEMSEAHNKINKPDNNLKNSRDLNLNQNNHCNSYGEDDDDEEEDEEFDHQIKVLNCTSDVPQHPSTSRASPEAMNADDQVAPNSKEDESYIVIIREHQNSHHGHSHTHGHVHSPPKTMSSVAWMVIMGDGLHNFTDGVAIGAAFAANIGGGFSTAIAVFCHELPHELGDFAVLLKAGMSPKQAVFYNLLSSVLCLFGMVIGLVLGQNASASSWVFALAGGLFLYIGLVDMIPELTSGHSKEGGSLCQCLLQFLGLLIGVGIMLMIALFEHDIKTVFKT